MDIQLRVFRPLEGDDILQQRTKTVWSDGSYVGSSYLTWTKWYDIPIVLESIDNDS